MTGGISFKFGPDLAVSNWRYQNFPRRPGAQFDAAGEDTLVVRTNAGVGILWRPVPPSGFEATTAHWRWRVMQGVGSTDLTKKGGDDRALAVYFAFTDNENASDQTNLLDLLRQGHGNLLVYVWGGAAKEGAILQLPYFNSQGRTLVKRSADAPHGVWFSETANIHDDFRRGFGRLPGKLVAVAVSSDSDDTGEVNLAALADFCIN